MQTKNLIQKLNPNIFMLNDNLHQRYKSFYTRLFTTLIGSVLLMMLLSILVSGCSPTRKANKLANKAIENQISFAKVGKHYILINGCLVDTTKTSYGKGKDSIIYERVTDTVLQKVPCDSFTQTRGRDTITVTKEGRLIVRTETKTLTRVDTVTNTIIDATRVNICLDSLNWYRSDNRLKVQEIRTYASKLRGANVTKWLFLFLFLATLAGAIYFGIKRKIIR